MLEAVGKIQIYTAGDSYETFIADNMTVDASLRNIIIIGEAANHIPDTVKGRYPDIPWLQIRGMRNTVVHNYFELDFDIIWDAIEHDVPLLGEQLQIILDNE